MSERLTIVIDAKDQASPALKGIAGNTKAIGDAAKKAGIETEGGFGRAATAIKPYEDGIRSASMALVGLGAATVAFASTAISAAGQMERYSAQYKVLAGGAAEAEKRLRAVTDFAARTPFDLPGVIEADKLVMAFNLDIGGLEKTLEAFGDVAAAMGVPMDQVIRGFAKLKAGMFDMAEMAPLGITREELAKLGVQFSETGQVLNKDELLPAAIKLISRFSGTMAEMSKTTEGKLSNLSDSWFQLKAAAGTALTPTLKLAAEVLTAVSDAIKPIIESPIGNVLVAVGTAGGIAAGGLGMIGLAAPAVLRGLAAIEAALIKVGITSRATAATVGASATQMATATTAAGAAAGAGGATAGAGAGLAARGLGGRALGAVGGPWGLAAGAVLMGGVEGVSAAAKPGRPLQRLGRGLEAATRYGAAGMLWGGAKRLFGGAAPDDAESPDDTAAWRSQMQAKWGAGELAAAPAALPIAEIPTIEELIPAAEIAAATPALSTPGRQPTFGMTQVGNNAWLLPSVGPGGDAGTIANLRSREIGPNRYEIIFEVVPNIPAGVYDQHTSDWMEDLQYAGGA